MSNKEKNLIQIGLLSANADLVMCRLTDKFPKKYDVEPIALEQLAFFTGGSKFNILSNIQALVVNGLDEQPLVFRLAYLIRRTYPHIKLIMVVKRENKSEFENIHFDAFVRFDEFSAEIGPTLDTLKVGKNSLLNRMFNSFKRFNLPRSSFMA